ncbi:hypothetical protein ACVXZ4_05615 [Lacisediminihabitans sp. FW035]
MTNLTRTASSRRGRHLARRSIRSLVSVRSLIMTTLAFVLAIGLAGVATGGTYALWNKSQPTASNAIITSGNAQLTVSTALAMPTTAIYPGLVLYGSAALKNTGTIPLTLRTSGLTVPTSNAFTQALKVGFATAADSASCSTGAVTSAWVYSTFASPTVATIGTPLAVGNTAVLCVSTQFGNSPDNTVQGQSATAFVASIDGIQG